MRSRTEVVSPEYAHLKALFRGAKKAFVSVPYFSADGVEKLEASFRSVRSAEFWLVVNVTHWATGHADFDAIVGFLRRLSRGSDLKMGMRSTLHAKLYYALDRRRALLGSANLTAAGFGGNVEIAAILTGSSCDEIDGWIDQHRRKVSSFSLDDFSACVEATRDEVLKARESLEDRGAATSDEFNIAVDLFEKELVRRTRPPRSRAVRVTPKRILEPGKTRIAPSLGSLTAALPSGWPTYDSFCGFLKANKSRPEAMELLDRANGKYNLQGHVKHFFWAGLMFFLENPQLVTLIDGKAILERSVEWDTVPWMRKWKRFLATHDDEVYDDIDVSFHTLKVYLPPTLGGTTLGGGAGTGNFKRTIVLLAEMLRDVTA